MTANFLKYLTARLALAFFVFLVASYTSMYILYEQVGEERYNSILWPVIAIFSLLTPSVILSYVGKLRFNGFMIRAAGYDLTLDSSKAMKRFERLLHFASSFYFFPTTTEKLLKQIYQEYSKLFLGLHARSRAAQEVYEETILRHPGDVNLQNILLDIYNEKENLSKNEFKIGFHVFKHSLDNRKVIELLSKYYIKKNIFDFNSQEIFFKSIKLNLSSKEKAVDFLILKLIELQREDDFAAEVYLTAFSEYSNQSEPVMEAIIKLSLARKEKGRTDDLSQKIYKTYEGISENVRKQIEERISKDPLGKEDVFSTQKEFIKEKISSLFQKMLDPIKTIKISFKTGILKFQKFRFFNMSWLKKRSSIVFSIMSLAAILLVVMVVLPGKKNSKPSLNLLNINPQYSMYESKLPYSIQVAAFKTLKKAEKVIDVLYAKGEKAYYTKTSEKSAWYRIRVGEFTTKKEAKFYAEKLLKKKLIKGYFITNFEPGFIKINEG